MTTIKNLFQQRARLQQYANGISAALGDIESSRKAGLDAAGYAAAWAAVLMTCDILRTGLSAGDRRAALLFPALDRAIERANRVMKLFGGPTLGGKQELMASLDPNLRNVAMLTQDVREAQSFLRKNKINPPKPLALVLDLAMGMTDDTLLLLQAGQTQQAVGVQSDHARQRSIVNLRRVERKLREIDGQIIHAFAQLDLFNRTA